jgi:transposase
MSMEVISTMDVVYRCCAGLDVHKQTVECAVRRLTEGGTVQVEIRQFGTMTDDLLEMVKWLTTQGVTHVAMESTGVFWKPIYNVLEGNCTVLLVNARHVKQVPGRKTDVRDCQWLAQLLQYGLLKGSFIAPRWQRDLRDLTRERTQLSDEQTRVANRIHKVLEDANIKLGSVATDILGVSGQDILQGLIAGEEDVEILAQRARGRLRDKIPELRRALQGRLSEHHRFQLRLHWDHLQRLQELLERLNERIAKLTQPYQVQIKQLDRVVGIDQRSAESIVAEVGVDMKVFPSDGHLSAWAGICSGNNESAGKRRSGRIRKGSRWLRRTLVLAAQAAGHAKDSFLASRFRRLAARRGKKRACIAVGHSILKIVYHILKDGVPYRDLGGSYFDRLDPKRLTRYLVRRLERLGHKVTLEPATTG